MASLRKRGNVYYAQYYVGKRQKRVSLETSSLQVAKEKIRQIESALVREVDIPLPTKTPVGASDSASNDGCRVHIRGTAWSGKTGRFSHGRSISRFVCLKIFNPLYMQEMKQHRHEY